MLSIFKYILEVKIIVDCLALFRGNVNAQHMKSFEACGAAYSGQVDRAKMQGNLLSIHSLICRTLQFLAFNFQCSAAKRTEGGSTVYGQRQPRPGIAGNTTAVQARSPRRKIQLFSSRSLRQKFLFGKLVSELDYLRPPRCRHSKKQCVATRVCIGMFFVQCIIQSVSAEGTNAFVNTLLTTNSPFVLYLENPPWIKEMCFVENIFWEAGPEPGQEKVKGWVESTNRVAIQPSGMYFELLNPSPVPFTPPASSTQKVVQGISDSYFWEANLDRHEMSLSPRGAEEGGSENNRLPQLLQMEQQLDIGPARYFGFPPLSAGSFKLTAQNDFTAATTEGRLLSGEVLDAYNDRPIQLKYSLDNDPNNYVIITYRYGSGELPIYFERHQPRNKFEYLRDKTNWILLANYGVDPTIHEGYRPSIFFSNLTVFSHVILESNEHRYVVMPFKEARQISETYTPLPPTLPPTLPVHRAPRIIVAAVLIVFFVGGGIFIWGVALRRGK